MGTFVHAFSFDTLEAGLILNSYASKHFEEIFPLWIRISQVPPMLDLPQNPQGYSVDT